MEVMRGEAHPLWFELVRPMHRAVKQLSPLATGGEGVAEAIRCADADPPRRVAGGASLGRARPLASLVILAGTASSGPMPFGSLLRRYIDLRRLRRAFLREPSPHSVIRVRHHRALARHVPSCRARALARPRIGREAALTPLPPRLSHPFATSPLRMTTPRDVAPISPVFGLVRDASTSRESFRC